MLELGHMNFFNVDFCGLYRIGSEKSNGCELDETFELISEWVDGRPLNATIPWDPMSSRKNKPKCYCKDIYKHDDTGDYFVVLWKSDTESSGTILGAGENSETGTGKLVKFTNSYKGKKVIWGRPCYYWVVPKYNLIASIKFEHSICDAQLFEDYVKGCINNRVKHQNKTKEHTETGFVRMSYNDDLNKRYAYRFNMHLKSLNTSSSELQSLAANVTHIVRRETIIVNSKDERAEWIKIFDKIPLIASNPKSNKRKIEINAEAKPTVVEVRKIIEENAKELRKSGDWDNVGFKTIKGITWVDKFRLTSSIELEEKKDTVFRANELCSKIVEDRNQLLKPIIHDLSSSNKIQKN